jgi:DNA-binding transcriptional MerR regulator
MKGYTTREVQRLVGLSPERIREYARAGVLAPARGPGRQYVFGFRDLVLLRTARALLDARVPQHRVLRTLRVLKAQLAPDRSLTEVKVVADGGAVLVHDGDQAWDPISGQLHLAFPTGREGAAHVVRARPDGGDGVTLPTTSVDHWLELGLRLEMDAPEQARAAYERVLALEPHHADALVNLGRLLYEQGATEAAIVHYRRALEAAGGDHPIAAFNLGLALEDVGRNRAAADAYSVALAADPAFADACYNLSRVHERLGDRVSALRWLKSYRALTRQGT